MSFAAAVDHLHALTQELAPGTSAPRRKFDLAHMRILAHALGDPQTKFPSILIAGTNGKGSTAATLASILTAAGYRTGLYTSPHLTRVTERIRMLSPEILHDQITIDDPVVLEKPFTYTVAFKRMASDYEMVEFVCDNNREYVDEKGIVRLKLHNQ